jgi:hypothetical protein
MALATNHKTEFPSECSTPSLVWTDNSSAKKMLDLIVSLLKEEYIKVVRENPEIFSQ